MTSKTSTQAPLATAPYERVAELLRSRDRFLLTGHVRADGDCLGAQSALFHVLRSLGKSVQVVNPDPLDPRYEFLRAHTPYTHFDAQRPEGGIAPFDVACVLDVSVIERCGAVADRIRASKATTCVFDHHQPSTGQSWDVELIDSTAPATGVLVHRLAARMGISLPVQALEAIFVSLTTDTGWFKYSNTDRETFAVASELVAGGVDPSVIFGRLYQTNPPEFPRGVGVALRTLRYEAGGRLAIVSIRQAQMAAASAELHDTDEVLDILRSVGKVDAVLLFRENAPGRVKISARSKGTFDVNALLKPFGGGGHLRAAGADLPGPFEETAERVIGAAVRTLEASPPVT